MAGYIGPIPVPQATQTRETFTATASQATFNTGGYTPGFIDVFMNGVKLASADFTATNGSDVVLATGAAVGDIIEVVAYTAFEVLNQNFTGNTSTQDLTVSGNLTVTGTTLTIDTATAQTVDLGDNDKIQLGDGDDLQIYHDGSHSYIDEQGTGSLQLRATNLNIKSAANETYIACVADGQVELYHNNSKKFETTSSGVDVTGTGSIINAKASSGTAAIGLWEGVSSRFFLVTPNGSDGLTFVDGDGSSERMRIDSSGNVGIGLSSGIDRKLHVQNNNDYAAKFGGTTGGDYAIEIGQDGNSGSAGFNATGNSGAMKFSISGSERMRIDSSGNLLVGKTSSDGAIQGHELRLNNFAIHTVDNGPALYARRIGAGTNDYGAIQVFQNNDGDVGGGKE